MVTYGTPRKTNRRGLSRDNVDTAAQQARLTSRNDTYRSTLPAQGLARDPLAAYTRAMSHDPTISLKARRRAMR